MATDRKIKLVIDVTDEQVKQATSSMTRLEKATKEVGKSGNDLKNVDDNLTNITSSLGGLAAGFNPVTAIVTAATVAITAFTAAMIAATKFAFELAQSFAQYGSEVYKAQQITGLTAETLSALKIEVEKTGGNFESVIDAVAQYASKIADAAKGSKEAQKELNSLGINGKKYLNDMEGALGSAFKALNNLPIGLARAAAAQKIFGEEGARILLPLIAKADGDFSKLTENLKEFGIILGEEDVQKAREFNKAMKEVQMELRGVGLTLGRELLPVARDVFRAFSGFYKENKAEIKEWGVYIADVFRGVFTEIKAIINFVKENWGFISESWQTISGIARYAASGGKGGIMPINTYGYQGSSKPQPKENSIEWQLFDSSKVKTADTYFKPDAGSPKKFQLSSKAQAIVTAAEKLGISPLDLATIVSYETAGTFSPNIKGGKGGNYQGAIQFGPEERKQFGVYAGQSFENQMTTSVVEYFKTRFNSVGRTTQGATLLDLYKTVNGGNPNVSSNASDGFTIVNGVKVRNTISGHVSKMSQQHRANALSKLFGGSISNIPSNNSTSNDYEAQMKNIIDLDNQAFAREKFEKLAAFYKATSAITPSADFIKSYTDFLNKDIPLDRNKVSTFDVKKQFEKSQQGVTSEGQSVSEPTDFRLTLGGEYLKQLNESLETEKKIEQVVALREKHQEIINALFKDALADQDLQLENLGNQYELQQKLFSDETYRRYAQDIANLEEKVSLEREIFDLENNIANGGINDSLKVKAALLGDIIDLREREVDAIIQINRAELELSQKGNFSQNQADAAILQHLNSVRSVTEIYAEARIGIIDTFWGGLDSIIGKATAKMGFFGGLIKQLILDFVKLATLKPLQNILAPGTSSGGQQQNSGGFSLGNLFQKFLGGGGQSSGGYSAPGFAGGTFNIPGNFSFAGAGGNGLNLGGANFSGSINRLFGGGSTGSIGADGGFNVSGSSFGRNEFAGTIASNATSQLSNYTKFKSLFSGKGNLLGSIAPMLGIGLGSSVGGDSLGGQILGGIGGLAGGLAVSLATGAMSTTAGVGGALVGLFGSVIGATAGLAAIAAPLIIGAYLLKRNKLRRKEETARNQLMLDTLAELNKIKTDMEAARPGTNIQSLLDNTREISANYFTEANKLTDKKTRGIAIKDGNERVGVVPPNAQFPNALTNQIYALSESAKAKEAMRGLAGERDRRLLPEFAMGGYIPAKNGGHLAVVGEGGYDEFILSTDPKYANRTANLLGSFIEKMNYKLPKFQTGGISSGVNLSQSNSTFSNSAPSIVFSPNLTLHLNQKDDGSFEGYLESGDGKRHVIEIFKDARKNREI